MSAPALAALMALSAALASMMTLLCVALHHARKRTGKTSRKRKTSNVVLLVLGLFILAFIVTMVVTYWRFQSVPDSLIQYTLGAGGLEALVLAFIKITKIRRGEHPDADG